VLKYYQLNDFGDSQIKRRGDVSETILPDFVCFISVATMADCTISTGIRSSANTKILIEFTDTWMIHQIITAPNKSIVEPLIRK
jgi:hypothetical protein